MKKLKFLIVISIFAGFLGVEAAISPQAEAAVVTELVNPSRTDTLLTASNYERTAVVNSGWFVLTSWEVPDSSSSPVYRMYNPNAGQHYFTKHAYERDQLIAAGWNYEGVTFYSVDKFGVNVGMFYNSSTGAHAYSPAGSPFPGFVLQSTAFAIRKML